MFSHITLSITKVIYRIAPSGYQQIFVVKMMVDMIFILGTTTHNFLNMQARVVLCVCARASMSVCVRVKH